MANHVAENAAVPSGTAFAATYLAETADLVRSLSVDEIEEVAGGLAACRAAGGRLFVLGVGGSAAHASHAVNDFRKLCRFEAYAPTDNVSELTARTNDDGWDTTFQAWLEVSHLSRRDAVLVLSVGGGDLDRNVSPNIVNALLTAERVGCSIFGIVGRDGGYTAKVATACVVIPPRHEARITPHTEGLCSVVWHLLVSHPILQVVAARWESEAVDA